MIITSLTINPKELEARTGWALKAEGACKGDLCVPLPEGAIDVEGRIEAQVLADRLGMPLIHDETAGVWSLGPETLGGKALTSAQAPALTLPDWQGADFQLQSLRGQKVALIAWASW